MGTAVVTSKPWGLRSSLGWQTPASRRGLYLPSGWKGRPLLSPKSTHPSDPGDYRPITVTPLVTRNINKILAKRIGTVAPLPTRQKGFKPKECCGATLALIDSMVRAAKTGSRNLYVAWVDFKKAFDSVGHPSLERVCQRWGFPPMLTEYVSNAYSVVRTRLVKDGS